MDYYANKYASLYYFVMAINILELNTKGETKHFLKVLRNFRYWTYSTFSSFHTCRHYLIELKSTVWKKRNPINISHKNQEVSVFPYVHLSVDLRKYRKYLSETILHYTHIIGVLCIKMRRKLFIKDRSKDENSNG